MSRRCIRKISDKVDLTTKHVKQGYYLREVVFSPQIVTQCLADWAQPFYFSATCASANFFRSAYGAVRKFSVGFKNS